VSSTDRSQVAHRATADRGAKSAPAGLDEDSLAWLRALRSEGRSYDEAVRRLHDLLFRASQREVIRRRGSLPRTDVDDLAAQCADDATVAVLGRLSSYRGASRFTTWAYKFAVLTTSVAVRRLAWRDREVPTDPLAWPVPEDISFDLPEHEAEATAVAQAVRVAIDTRLTPHQREVLLAVTVHGVPIDVLAARLATTRGALYKTLHMARARLRRGLEEQGLTIQSGRRS
jgi:RNA polymerase sigma-70 factor (ECF subfamily)